jgi:hypothetical protein
MRVYIGYVNAACRSVAMLFCVSAMFYGDVCVTPCRRVIVVAGVTPCRRVIVDVACRSAAMLYCDICVRCDAVYIGNCERRVTLGGHVVTGDVMYFGVSAMMYCDVVYIGNWDWCSHVVS